jgi:hypothetical protein
MRNRILFLLALAVVGIPPQQAHAQTDLLERLSIHSSLNTGYGKSDNLQFFGIDKDGTAEYRALTLQFSYQIDDNDRVVTQFLHRYNGNSPINAVTPSFFPVWAFYEHTFGDRTKVKVGRAPLPRGLFNEVRFIGTLLPFYRVGRTVYGETLEQLDGIAVSRPFDVGSWRLETSAFGGGYDLKALLPDANGAFVLDNRVENSVGGQVFVDTPIDGVRFGGFFTRQHVTPNYTVVDSLRQAPRYNYVLSAEGVFSRGFVRGEYTQFENADNGEQQYSGWYAQAGVKPVSAMTIAAEYQEATVQVDLPAPVPTVYLPMTKELTLGVSWQTNPNIVFKFEAHRVTGYDFDSGVPTIIPPVAPPFIAGIAPASKSHYLLASVAVAF